MNWFTRLTDPIIFSRKTKPGVLIVFLLMSIYVMVVKAVEVVIDPTNGQAWGGLVVGVITLAYWVYLLIEEAKK